MKQFLKYTFATLFAIFIATVLGFVLLFGFIGVIANSDDEQTVLTPKSIYQIDFEGTLVDRSDDNPFSEALSKVLGRDRETILGLDDLLTNIEKAKNDSNIVGIYLKGGSLQGGIASFKEIRNALLDFKKTGKFIVAYADNYSQKMYYLASVANQVLINPQGMLELKGLSSESVFLKNTLDKLGVEMQIVKVGTFKSAVEPLIATKMSEANRQQVTVYLKSIWNNILTEISLSRTISIEKLNSYADEMMMFQPTERSKSIHLVDSLVYVDQVENILKSHIKDPEKELNLVRHSSMIALEDQKKYNKVKVAVIYAIGDISDEFGEGIVARDLSKTIQEVAKDSSIKSVVLRVSSPGGSAYASEQIWRALTLLKKSKPLVVSMGDYAASGGYYISCMADLVVAQPTTITGSIGIFGIIPNIQGLNEKIGLSYDGVKTNRMSDAITVNRPFTPQERDLMQNYVNRGYELFVKRCAEGRKKTIPEIKRIAEGRVWTGDDAYKIGLVDTIGGLSQAIKMAASIAKLESYQVSEFPLKENLQQKFLKNLTDDVASSFLKAELGEQYDLFTQISKMKKLQGIQARLPYNLIIR